MNFDWQTIGAALVVLAALAYVARRGLARLRSFTAGGSGAAASADCGSCPSDKTRAATTATRPTVLVQIGRDRKHSPR